MNKYFGLFIGLGIVFCVLIGFLLFQQWPLWFGQTVILDTAPVDPFDPFRGQYIIINYEISLVTIDDFEQGDTVYVTLIEDNGIWREAGVSDTKPDDFFIKGKVDGNRVVYGIEQFFFERNADVPTQDITVEAKILPSGRAAFSRLFYQGEPFIVE